MNVLATVILDPPSALVFGSVLAVLSFKKIRAEPAGAIRKTVVLTAGWSAWYGLCVAWFFFMRPDWMFVYLLDTAKVPLFPAFLVFWAALVGYGAMGALGAGLLIQQQKLQLAIAGAVAATLFYVGLTLISNPAYVKVGSFADYTKGVAPGLETDGAMTTAMAVSGVGIAVGAVVVLVLQFKKPKAA